MNKRSVEVIKLLLDEGSDLKKVNSDKDTCLILAVKHEYPYEIIKLFVDHGADVEQRGMCQRTVIWAAVSRAAKKNEDITLLELLF